MTAADPQLTPGGVIAPKSRFRRSSAIGVLIVLLLAGLAAGAFEWRRQTTERLYQAALAASSQGDIVIVHQALRRLPAESYRTRLLRAVIELRSNRLENALRNLDIAAQNSETALWARFLAGEALCRIQDYEACITTLRGALQADPEHVDGHRWLAVAYFDIGASAEAVEQLKEVIRLDPADSRAYRMLGLIYTEAEEFPQAIEAYRASLDRSRDQPDLEQILAELATAQLKVNLYEDALSTLDGAPATSELESLRAEALYALGRDREAKQTVDQVLRGGETQRALVLRGLMLLDAGQASAAVAPLRRAVELQPEDFETRAKLTQAYAQAGNADGARQELVEFERIKKIRQEIHELTLVAANRPDAAETRYELGLRYQRLGLLTVARKWMRAAVALDPAHAAARKRLAELTTIIETSDRSS